MIESLLIYLFTFFLMAVVSGNNLPASAGALIGSRILTKKEGIAIAILGYVIGFALQGSLLQAGFARLLPVANPVLILIALASSSVVFIMAHLLRVPQSLTVALTTAIIGIDIAYSGTAELGFLGLVVTYWIFAVAISVILVAVAMRLAHRSIAKLRIWATLRAMKVAILGASFLTAFVLGANTLGFVYAAVLALHSQYQYLEFTAATISIIFGSVFFSSGELKRIGYEIMPIRYLNAAVTQSVSMAVIELGTLFSIPISVTEVFTAGIYGASLSYRTRLLLRKHAMAILVTWIISAVVSFSLGFAMTKLLL